MRKASPKHWLEQGCRRSRGFITLNGKASGCRQLGQSCRTRMDSAIVIKVCELTYGQLSIESSRCYS